MDLKIYSLERKPTTVTRQLTKSRDFCQNYLCDLHLCSLFASFSFCIDFATVSVEQRKTLHLPSLSPSLPPLEMEENWRRQVESLPKHDQINFKLKTLTTEWGAVNTDYDFLKVPKCENFHLTDFFIFTP
jgi:hypothetical protein